MFAALALAAVLLALTASAAYAQGNIAPGLIVGEPRVTDASGMPVAQVAPGETVLVTSTITSSLAADQPYVHIVRVDDSAGVTQSVTWAWGTVAAGEGGRLASVWIPREAGEYEATVLLWESIDEPFALAPKSTVHVTVANATVRAVGEPMVPPASVAPPAASARPTTAPPATGAVVVIPEGTGIAGCERDDECYLPPRVEVAAGATVTWENNDFAAHTVTAGAPGAATGEFDSGLILGGESFEHAFAEAGEYPYYCIVHPWMAGSVVVHGDAPVAPAPVPAAPPEPMPAPVPPVTLPRAAGTTVSIPGGTSLPGCEEANGCYLPPTLVVDPGATVTWENNDAAPHTITSGSQGDSSIGTEFDSGLLVAGTTFEHTFEEAGEYPYFCIVHPWRVGSVVVGDAASAVPRPSAPAPVTPPAAVTPAPVTPPAAVTPAPVTPPAAVTPAPVTPPAAVTPAPVTPPAAVTPAPVTPPAAVTPALPAPTGSMRVDDLTVMTPGGSGVPGCQEDDTCFIPSTIEVEPGATVTWVHDDITPHTITSGSQGDSSIGTEFDSGLVMAGETFEHTFEAVGEYPYFCQVHPWMTGSVVVGDLSRPTPPPAAPTPPASTEPVPRAAGETVRTPEGSGVPGCQEDDTCFIPSTIEVAPGTTVTWENNDIVPHTVTSGAAGSPTGEFDSGLSPAGATFEHTFEEVGTYPYFCLVHPWMAGSVTVR